jgi:hypothetical protein
MYEFAARMLRAQLKRSRPEASGPEIDAAIQNWLLDRPDAPRGS